MLPTVTDETGGVSSAPAALRQLAWRGMRLLFGRQVINLLIGFLASIVLARVLSPAVFGTFAIVTFLANLFTLFGDFGLAASFIQRSEELSNRHLQISFTVQSVITTLVILLTWVLAPWILRPYPSLDSDTVWLIRVSVFSLFFGAFRSVSVVSLERNLRFGPIARTEAVETFAYNFFAVVLALLNFGVWSFVLATMVRGLAGSVLMYRAAPWPVRLRFEREEARKLLGRSMSFQASGVLNVLGGAATPAVVGTLIGPQAVGYLGFASANAKRPLMVVEAVMRVSFPHFSRLQADEKELHQITLDYLTGFVWLVCFWWTILSAIVAPLVKLVYSDNWLPAVDSLVIFAAALPLDVVCWTMGYSFFAVGRNWAVVRTDALKSISMFGLSFVLVPIIGFPGIPWAYLISSGFGAMGLLWTFSPGFLKRAMLNTAWIGAGVLASYASGRLVWELIPVRDGVYPVYGWMTAGALAAIIYIGLSLVLAPSRYRNRFLSLIGSRFGRTFYALRGSKNAM